MFNIIKILFFNNITKNFFKVNYILSHFNIYVTWFFIMFLIQKLFSKKTIFIKFFLNLRTTTLLSLTYLLTLITYCTNSLLNEKFSNSSNFIHFNRSLFLIHFIFLIFIIIFIFGMIKKEKDFELHQNKITLSNLKEYANNLEYLHNQNRKFKHDYINIFLSMVGYLENNDIEGLKIFFNKNILPLNGNIRNYNFKLDLLKNIEIIELKGILSSKVIKAKESGITVTLDVTESIYNIDINIIDICKVIGILLDNAIDASLKCNNPIIKIAIINKETSVLFVIINNFKEDLPSIDKLFIEGFSTKGTNRGLGLSNLKETLNKYNNILLDTSLQKNLFTQKLEIFHNANIKEKT